MIRASGILMPVFSLASDYGVGNFGEEAYAFVDFLKKAGQSYWQLLPLNPTNFGDSPYQSFSSDAGNPYFIDPEALFEDGLLEKRDFVGVDFGDDDGAVDYGKLYKNRIPMLRKAFSRFDTSDKEYIAFCEKEAAWLDSYALFMAIKDTNGGKSWRDWPKPLRFSEKDALAAFASAHIDEIDFYKFVQFEFYKQWFALKEYANENGISVIGDIPIYVADDSVDVWSNTEQFDLDEDLLPNVVAGCPPDDFTEDGQLWGMPVYRWDYMKKGKAPYAWWRRRMRHAFEIYDIVRIDHFRGFEAFYCVDYGEETAKKGEWREGPGMDLFSYIQKDMGGDLPIIAEDLGFITEGVRKLLSDTGFPGMKILQFAFGTGADNEYLPHNYGTNCVVYTGTHDNTTVNGWVKEMGKQDVEYARKYMHVDDKEGFNWAMIRTAMMSVADTSIFLMADFMGLDGSARINEPATMGKNWQWRIGKGCVNDWLANIIRENTELYGRLGTQK